MGWGGGPLDAGVTMDGGGITPEGAGAAAGLLSRLKFTTTVAGRCDRLPSFMPGLNRHSRTASIAFSSSR